MGSPDPRGPGRGGGVGKQQRAFANPPSPSPLPPLAAPRRPAGSRAGCAARGARPPCLPSPPHRPLAHGGRRGGRRRLRAPPPRAPPPPGLLAAIPTLLPRLPQLPVAHGLGGGRGGARACGAAAGRAAPAGTPPRAAEEAPGRGGGEGGGGGGLRRPRDPQSAPRPLRPLPSFSFARSSPAPARRLAFVRGDGVAPRPPEGGAGHLSAGPELRPRPWRRDPPARLGASRVSRLLGKPRRGRHHEVRGARGGGRRAIVPREPRPLSLSLSPPGPRLPSPGPARLPGLRSLSPPSPFVPSHFFLSCNPPQPLLLGRGGAFLFSTFSRFSSNAPLASRISLPKFNVLLAPSPPALARQTWEMGRGSRIEACLLLGNRYFSFSM